MLCQYKNIFGKPNEGFHQDRFLGLAINDIIGTIIIGFAISYYFEIELLKVFIGLTVFVILIHKLFCVDTALNNFIFGK